MHSKNKRAMDSIERAHVDAVKSLSCEVCGSPGPSDAHEPQQGLWFLSIALCWDCHQGPHGWHGDKSRWLAAKMTEKKAINETLARVARLRDSGQVTLPITRKVPQQRTRKPYVKPSKIYRPEAA